MGYCEVSRTESHRILYLGRVRAGARKWQVLGILLTALRRCKAAGTRHVTGRPE